MDPNETLKIIQNALDTARTTSSKEEFLTNMIIVQDYAEYAFDFVDRGGFLPVTIASIPSPTLL